MPTDKKTKKAKKQKQPPIIIAYQIERAASAIGRSVGYLQSAIDRGRLKVTRKKPGGRGRTMTLILAEELERFAEAEELEADELETDELETGQLKENPVERPQAAEMAMATWEHLRGEIVLDVTLADGRRKAFGLAAPELLASSLRLALSRRARDRNR